MKKLKFWVAGVSALVLGLVGAGSPQMAYADVSDSAGIAPTADAAFKAWNDAFLVRNGGDAYYTDTLKSRGTTAAKWFVAALDIAVAEDVYQRTHSPQDRQLVMDLVQSMIKNNGRDWTPNSWNDDMAWMTLTTIRGYQATGTADWLNIATDNWNKTYNRGWNPVGGGGIWEDNNRFDRGKCALSNNPMITAAVQLYQITGDRAYLDKAMGIYDWVRRTLVNTSTGLVNGCVFFPGGTNDPGTVTPSDNVYDAGSWIEAANLLYRVTGNSMYYNDAQRSADHIVSTVPIIHQNQGRGTSYQYRFFRGLSEFCTDNNICGRYRGYMLANANSAWNHRDGSNLTWNDWLSATNASNPDAFEMASAVAIWQQIPTNDPPAFSGNYQLKNAASNMFVTVAGGSTANSAAVVQTNDGNDPSALWTFVLQSNGHYQIKNVRSGQMLNVSEASGALGKPVSQWPAQGARQANDKWLPIRNSDGTYSFYNRNSQFALDDPGASVAVGTQYVQWAQNDSLGQRFTLTPAGTGAPMGAVRSGVAGKCLDLNAGNPANGTRVQLWTCNNHPESQTWTSSGNTLRIAGKCLDAAAYGTANGTKIVLSDCTGASNQVWTPSNGGYVNPASGRCLDDPGATTADGTQLQLYDCNNTPAQMWSRPGA